MKLVHYLLLLGITLCCCSCFSYRIPKDYRKLENHTRKRNAYVYTTPLKKEYKILDKSHIFTLVYDSLQADLRIRLYPLKRQGECGQGSILSMITLGQIPVSFWDQYTYEFDEIENTTITKRKLEFIIHQRLWFWDVFSFNKRFDEKMGKLILGKYQESP
jgi:hypothetical protein